MFGRLLNGGFGIRGYRRVRTGVRDGGIQIVIEQPRDRLRCPRCGTPEVVAKGTGGHIEVLFVRRLNQCIVCKPEGIELCPNDATTRQTQADNSRCNKSRCNKSRAPVSTASPVLRLVVPIRQDAKVAPRGQPLACDAYRRIASVPRQFRGRLSGRRRCEETQQHLQASWC
jgi:hypothetical protein